MKKMLEWIIRHKIKTILIIFGLFFVPLIVIHILFSFSMQNDFIAAKWSAGELIGYISGFYAFVGTVALGALALWQNEKANEINDKLTVLEAKSKLGYFLPKSKLFLLRNKFEQSLVLENCGNGWVTVNKSICAINNQKGIEDDIEFFAPPNGEFTTLCISLSLSESDLSLDELKIVIHLQMYNSQEYHYIQELHLFFIKENDDKFILDGFNAKIK